MDSADNRNLNSSSEKEDHRISKSIGVNELSEKMKKVEVKPKDSPTSILAKSSVLLPTGVARVKQLSAVQSGPIKSSMTSTGSATGNPRNKTALAPGHSLMDWIRLGSSGVDLTGVGGVYQVVTPAELAKHNERNDAWIAIRGIVFNITRYMDFHPGGVDELMRGVGKDATKLFEDVHAWVNYQSILQKCIVGRLSRSGPVETDSTLGNNKKPTPKLSPLVAGVRNLEQNEKSITMAPKLQSDWKQTTNTVSFVYKTTGNQSPGFQLIRESEIEFNIKICLQNSIVKHEYDLTEGVEWPPKWEQNFESMETTFIFTKLNGSLWKSYGSRTVVNETKNSERSYRSWEIVSNTLLCDDVHLLVIKSKDYLEIIPVGHHVEAKMNVMGVEVSRPYTPVPPCLHPANKPPEYTPDCLCLIIKKYNEGTLSPSIIALKHGQTFSISSGLGTFVVESYDKYSTIHMLAAGTGLTPMLGIIQRALGKRNVSTINLLNFNKEEKDIFYGPQLAKVCEDKRLKVIHILSQADDSWSGKRGIVSEVLLKELIGDAVNQSCIFTCGPTPFMAVAQEALQKLGWKATQIYEFYG